MVVLGKVDVRYSENMCCSPGFCRYPFDLDYALGLQWIWFLGLFHAVVLGVNQLCLFSFLSVPSYHSIPMLVRDVFLMWILRGDLAEE